MIVKLQRIYELLLFQTQQLNRKLIQLIGFSTCEIVDFSFFFLANVCLLFTVFQFLIFYWPTLIKKQFLLSNVSRIVISTVIYTTITQAISI